MAAEGKRLLCSAAAQGPPPGSAGSQSRCQRSAAFAPRPPLSA